METIDILIIDCICTVVILCTVTLIICFIKFVYIFCIKKIIDWYKVRHGKIVKLQEELRELRDRNDNIWPMSLHPILQTKIIYSRVIDHKIMQKDGIDKFIIEMGVKENEDE